MYKSALIFGVVALVVGVGATVLSPICTPCTVVFLGLGAGYLAAYFDKPATTSGTSRAGAIAGALGGVGALFGQWLGTAVNGLIMGPQGAQQFNQMLNLPSAGPGFKQGYWLGLIGSGLCIGLLDVLLMGAFGALGAYLWWQTSGKHASNAGQVVIGG